MQIMDVGKSQDMDPMVDRCETIHRSSSADSNSGKSCTSSPGVEITRKARRRKKEAAFASAYGIRQEVTAEDEKDGGLINSASRMWGDFVHGVAEEAHIAIKDGAGRAAEDLIFRTISFNYAGSIKEAATQVKSAVSDVVVDHARIIRDTVSPGSAEESDMLRRTDSGARRHNDLFYPKDCYGRSPAHQAAWTNVVAQLESIWAMDPEMVCEEDSQGFTPAHIAAAEGQLRVIKFMYQKDIRLLSAESSKDGCTPAHRAAATGQTRVIRFLMQIDMNLMRAKRRSDGSTPIHRAAVHGHWNVVELIASADASLLSEESRDGMTPAHVAAAMGHIETLHAIGRRAPSKLFAVSAKNGCTPLDLAEDEACRAFLAEAKNLCINTSCGAMDEYSGVFLRGNHLEVGKSVSFGLDSDDYTSAGGELDAGQKKKRPVFRKGSVEVKSGTEKGTPPPGKDFSGVFGMLLKGEGTGERTASPKSKPKVPALLRGSAIYPRGEAGETSSQGNSSAEDQKQESERRLSLKSPLCNDAGRQNSLLDALTAKTRGNIAHSSLATSFGALLSGVAPATMAADGGMPPPRGGKKPTIDVGNPEQGRGVLQNKPSTSIMLSNFKSMPATTHESNSAMSVQVAGQNSRGTRELRQDNSSESDASPFSPYVTNAKGRQLRAHPWESEPSSMSSIQSVANLAQKAAEGYQEPIKTCPYDSSPQPHIYKRGLATALAQDRNSAISEDQQSGEEDACWASPGEKRGEGQKTPNHASESGQDERTDEVPVGSLFSPQAMRLISTERSRRKAAQVEVGRLRLEVMSLRAELWAATELKATTGYGGKLGSDIAANSIEGVDVKQEVCVL